MVGPIVWKPIWKQWAMVLLLIVAIVYGFRLGDASLWDIDEAIYADISRNMAESGDWIVPVFNGEPRFDKPPLLLWINGVAIKLLGQTELAARTGTFIFALLTIGFAYICGSRLFSPRVGFLSALILASTVGWFLEGRIGLLDTALSFFVGLSVYQFFLLYRGEKAGYLGLSIVLALGVLTKGPVILLLVGTIIFLFLGWSRFWTYLLSWWTMAGLAVFAAVALPWHIAIYRRAGNEWLNDYFGYHMFTRFIQPIEEHGFPWYFYFGVLAAGFLPWSGLVGVAAWNGLRSWLKNRRFPSEELKLTLIWFSVIFVFFSASRTKLPNYILPAFVPLAFLLGVWFDRQLERGRRVLSTFRTGLWSSVIIGLLAILGLLAVRHLVPEDYSDAYRILFIIPVTLILGMVATELVYWIRKSYLVFILGFAGTAFLVMISFSLWIIPLLELQKPVKPLALAAQTYLQPETRLVSAMGDASTSFYTKRSVVYLNDVEDVRRLLSDSSQPVLALVPESMLDSLQDVPGLRVLESWSFGRLVSAASSGEPVLTCSSCEVWGRGVPGFHRGTIPQSDPAHRGFPEGRLRPACPAGREHRKH